MSKNKDLDEIISKLDMKDFFQKLGVSFKAKKKASCFMCQDPEHLAVDIKTGVWHCHKCKEGGNAITAYAKAHNCSNGDAVKAIKSIVGWVDDTPPPRTNKNTSNKKTDKPQGEPDINNPTEKTSTETNKEPTQRDIAYSKNQLIYQRLVELLHLTDADREHLKKERGFTDSVIDELKFRSAGKYIKNIIESLKTEFTAQELVNSGVMLDVNGTHKVDDQLLQDKIIIPYLDKHGKVIHLRPHKLGFKGIPSQIYGEYFLREKPERIVLTEGEFKATALLS